MVISRPRFEGVAMFACIFLDFGVAVDAEKFVSVVLYKDSDTSRTGL